ncbi:MULTISPECIES: chloramphenicol phosphotransferase CPT family protein [unclassified Ruegeria]|uniref:chloramphenicol phosphotransferase CPT family protein n=1 Tax=unclassified Ruegeria TaxID=2625375 RepID=UPI001489F4E3|nr:MULTISPECIES: AAA family ATPase [unclassified Ruegeria]
MAQIIFLHGASSSGKSTIARALQRQIERPFWHISIDHLRDSGVIPMARFRAGDFEWSKERARVFEGFHASIGAYADAGNDLILEHILDTDGWDKTLQQVFAPHDVLFVAIHCALMELARRETGRADRAEGSAVQDQKTIHKGRRYDLELRSEDGIEANVDAILNTWRSGVRCSDFS